MISRDAALKAEQMSNARTSKIVNFVETMQGSGGRALGAIAQRRHKLALDNFVKIRDMTLQAKIENQEQLDELAKFKRDFFAKMLENSKAGEDEEHRFKTLESEVGMLKSEISELSADVEIKQTHAAELKTLIECIRKSSEEEAEFEVTSGHPLAKTYNEAKQRAKQNNELVQTLCPSIAEAERTVQRDGLAASKLRHQAKDLEKMIQSREEVLGIIDVHKGGNENKHELSDPDEPDEDDDEADLEYVPDEDLKQELTQSVTKLRELRERLNGFVSQKQEMSAALLRCDQARQDTRSHLIHLAACIAADEREVQQDRPLPPSAESPERLLPSQWRRELDSNLGSSRHNGEMYSMLMLACSQRTGAAIDPESGSPEMHQHNNPRGVSFLNAQRVKLCAQSDSKVDSLNEILFDAESHWTQLLNLESRLTPAGQSPEQVERLQKLLTNVDCNHLWRAEDEESRMRLSTINKEQQKLMKQANLGLLKGSREARIGQVAQMASDVVESKKHPAEISVSNRPPAPSPSARGGRRMSHVKLQQTLR